MHFFQRKTDSSRRYIADDSRNISQDPHLGASKGSDSTAILYNTGNTPVASKTYHCKSSGAGRARSSSGDTLVDRTHERGTK